MPIILQECILELDEAMLDGDECSCVEDTIGKSSWKITFPFWKRGSQKRQSINQKSITDTNTAIEQLGIKQLLHLCQDDHCQKRKQEGTRDSDQKSNPTPCSDSKTSAPAQFFISKKPITTTNSTPKIQKKSDKVDQQKSIASVAEVKKTTSLDLKSGGVKASDKTISQSSNGSVTTTTIGKSAITPTMRSQSMNQADQPTSTTGTKRQQHQFPFTPLPLYPNSASSSSAESRRSHQATSTVVAAGFFGLIPPGLPTATCNTTAGGWNKRRTSGAIVGSRTFTSFDYALGLAGIDPTSASSSNCLFNSTGNDHFVVEFCEDLFPNLSTTASSATLSTDIIDSSMKTPKRKTSAPIPTSRTNKSNTGDSIIDHINGGQQQKTIEPCPSTPPSSPISGQTATDDESSPKRKQELERVDVVLALRGVTLREAVQGIVEKRQLNMDAVNLFLESSNTPLPWETDTSFLGGHKLYAKAKKDDSPFSKHPLFATNGVALAASISGHPSNSALANHKDISTVSGGHLFPISASALNIGSNARTASPGLSKNDRKLSLTQLTKKKTPDRLNLTPDSSSFALNLSTTAVNNDSMPAASAEKSSTSSIPTPNEGGSIFFNGGSSGMIDAVPSSSSTPQHFQNGCGIMMADTNSMGSSSIAGRKERSRSQGRLSQIFPNPFKQDDRLEMLERLTHFQEHGLMTAAGLLHDVNIILCQNALHLEERWQDLARNHETLTRKQQEQQEGLWELVTTELNYIKKLGCIVELQACVGALQAEGFLHDVDVDSIFGNITDICRANLRFWLQCLYPLLQYSRQTGEPLDPTKLESGFQHIDRLFYPYIPYCLNHVEMLCYIRRKQKESELFREFVMWVQSRRVFGRLHLTDLLAKPMQRLTKYPLLLKAVLKSTIDEPGRAALTNVIEKAEEFASRVNIELRHKQHYDALCNIMQCIESYDAIETANDELDRLVKEYSYVDLTAPMLGCRPKLLRQLLLRGELKLREGYTKMDVVCFLFTDMFLICKSIGKKGDRVRVKVVRPPYHLDRVVVRQLRETAGFAFVFLNEFNMPASAATFLTPNQEEACKWLEHFHMAKDEYQRMKMADEITVYKQQGRRSFDVSALSNSQPSHYDAQGDSSGRRASAHLTAPSVSGKDGGPQRRISMTAMDEKKHRKVPSTMDISHRKSSSMDSSVVTSAIVAAYRYSPLHGSVDGLRDALTRGPTEKVMAAEMIKSASEDDPTIANLPVPGGMPTEMDAGGDQEGMMRRLRANSVEMLRRLSPRLRTPSSSGDRSPSPRPASRGAASSVFSFRTATTAPISENSDGNTLSPFHSTQSTLHAGFSTPPTTPVPKLVDDNGRRLSGSHSPLLHHRSGSPFRKQKIPSPIFFKSDKQSKQDYCNSPGPTMAIDSGSRCASPSPSILLKSSVNSSMENDDSSAMPSPSITPGPYQPTAHHPTTNNRRLERRYHTADGIEELKPRRAPQPGILKRFSWSTPAAAAAAAAATASGSTSMASKSDLRKASQTTISSESFGSSSGVSSSSSQLYVSQSENELPLGEPCGGDGGPKMTSLSGRRFLKWSAVPRVVHQQAAESADHSGNGSPTGMLERHHHRNVSTIVIGEAAATLEAGEEDSAAESNAQPELPQRNGTKLSAKDNLRRKGIPIIETQAPTPLATPVTTQPTVGQTFMGASVQPTRPPGISKEDFLKLLLQGNLESSDV